MPLLADSTYALSSGSGRHYRGDCDNGVETVPGRPASAPNILVLYVGAEDCAPCRAWKSGEGTAFFASPDFARITYREVKSPHLQEILNDENWPDEIRVYRKSLQRSDGVPLWLVVSDHEIVEKQHGTAQWRANILPRIKSFLR